MALSGIEKKYEDGARQRQCERNRDRLIKEHRAKKGDVIPSVPSRLFKDNYDQINWGK